MNTAALTALALLAFAGNSLLCRLALAPDAIDAVSFTSVRIAAGAAILLLLVRRWSLPGSWVMAAALAAYALLFSWAYQRIGAAVGALVLFAAVQATMIGWGLIAGERLSPLAWGGLLLALGGLGSLAAPGLAAPDPLGMALMALAGAAWGVYSLLGRGVSAPVAATAGNFVRCLPLTLGASALTIPSAHATTAGLAWAAVSGAITSGLGYCVWYAALPRLARSQAASAQLAVPVIAALGAVVLLGEPLTLRLLGAMAAILLGVALAVLPRRQ